MIKFTLIALIVAALAGCSSRETAIAAIQADQAIEAVAKDLTGGSLQQVAMDPGTPESVRLAFDEMSKRCLALLNQARESLVPAIQRLSKGNPVEVSTSTQLALTDPDSFIRSATRQSVRADEETKQYLQWRQVISYASPMVSGIIKAPWWQQLLLIVTGGSTVGVTAAMAVRKMVDHGKVLFAREAYRREADQAFSPVELELVKQKNKKLQEDMGIHQTIVKKLKKSKG